ncbi:hypothetical protein CS022_21165 [Veronia nyctiphanis]|uniref:Uncharacterized protein n=1 Tax=Veronia nyctiphanis TaxID=1278244 RepID=A0A4Q0YKR9_9GAMM|nr:hypothetical protein [Veronia nyctiphanis]RXJ71342.1 hypothetical protein CS022_21165 [Veronia nyctiphanis]
MTTANKQKLSEKVWAESVTEKLHDFITRLDSNFAADTSQKLAYSNEIRQYDDETTLSEENKFETDILIYEKSEGKTWKPRLVIETKINSVNTHDSITYSHKAHLHKTVHPYLRYGMFIGAMGDGGLPARVLRHGEQFDFMLAWRDTDGSKKEWDALFSIVRQELAISQRLEESLYENRAKGRKRFFAYHRPLVPYPID